MMPGALFWPKTMSPARLLPVIVTVVVAVADPLLP